MIDVAYFSETLRNSITHAAERCSHEAVVPAELPVKGTTSQGREFLCTVYAPALFFDLQRFWGCDKMLVAELEFELVPADSMGSTFFYTHTRTFLLKSLPVREGKTLMSLAQAYHDFQKSTPSPLVRFCSLIHLKAAGYFVVMLNCLLAFSPEAKVFDLKGSSVGRTSGLQGGVMKDLDFIQVCGGLTLARRTRHVVLKSLRKLLAFLQASNLTDYSVLMAVEPAPANCPEELPSLFRGLMGDQPVRIVIGVIDALTQWGLSKRLESEWKALTSPASANSTKLVLSSTDAPTYSKRMWSFMHKVLFPRPGGSKGSTGSSSDEDDEFVKL